MTDGARSVETEPIITTLVEEWAALQDLLEATEWSMPTALPGWSGHDVAAHLIGNESRLSDEESPPLRST